MEQNYLCRAIKIFSARAQTPTILGDAQVGVAVKREFFGLFVFLLHASALLVPVSTWAADYQKGKEAYIRGDYDSALREWGPLSDTGHPQAQVGFGLMHEHGLGLNKILLGCEMVSIGC